VETIEDAITRIMQQLRATGERELPSRAVGEAVMSALREIDAVAYVRFASVYRDFQDVSEFQKEIQNLAAGPASPS
jgi:transcriptional repressor NrdR